MTKHSKALRDSLNWNTNADDELKTKLDAILAKMDEIETHLGNMASGQATMNTNLSLIATNIGNLSGPL